MFIGLAPAVAAAFSFPDYLDAHTEDSGFVEKSDFPFGFAAFRAESLWLSVSGIKS
jgi:hypothetical protein